MNKNILSSILGSEIKESIAVINNKQVKEQLQEGGENSEKAGLTFVRSSKIFKGTVSKVNNLDEKQVENRKKIEEKCAKINKVFKDYGIRAESIDVDMVQEAARFIRFPVKLKSGETVNSLNRYKNDIGIQLEANGEILIEHIKGTSYISVDIPFADSEKSIDLLSQHPYKESCTPYGNCPFSC